MKFFFTILSIILMVSCSRKRQENIFIIPIDRQHYPSAINLDTIKKPIVFSKDFWNYFTSAFPYPAVRLFYWPKDNETGFLLSGTSFRCSLISNDSKFSLINRLPENLSEEESDSYFKGGGFFVIPNDSNQQNLQDTQVYVDDELKWIKASTQVEKEYLEFYKLLENRDIDYLVIWKASLIDSFNRKPE